MAPQHRPVGNLVGLAVLGLLVERPMHPYDMLTTLQARGLDSAFKLRKASLYDVVRSLERGGWIARRGTEQQGGRPERTVYAPTDTGWTGFVEWIDELIRTPAKEYPSVIAAVSYLGALGPERAVEALAERAVRLEEAVEGARRAEAEAAGQGVPALFVLEVDFTIARLRAELDWVHRTIERIRTGALGWPETPGA